MGKKGHKHTEGSKKKMSEKKRKWWADLSEEKKKEVRKNISKNHARPALGKTGEKAPGWKGGRYSSKRDKYIYVWAPDHPNARKSGKGTGGYVLEHRLVMEKILGRYLKEDEDVNHINGDKKDNRPENLMVVRHHAHYHEMSCPRCEFKFWTR